jgi:hypothetical protein
MQGNPNFIYICQLFNGLFMIYSIEPKLEQISLHPSMKSLLSEHTIQVVTKPSFIAREILCFHSIINVSILLEWLLLQERNGWELEENRSECTEELLFCVTFIFYINNIFMYSLYKKNSEIKATHSHWRNLEYL